MSDACLKSSIEYRNTDWRYKGEGSIAKSAKEAKNAKKKPSVFLRASLSPWFKNGNHSGTEAFRLYWVFALCRKSCERESESARHGTEGTESQRDKESAVIPVIILPIP